MRQALAAYTFISLASRLAVPTNSSSPAVLRRKILGGAAAVQPPHPVPDEPLGSSIWHPSYAVRADEPRQEFLCGSLHGGQSHERGYGRNPDVPRYFETEYSQSHLASVLIANHTDVVTVSRQLGHSNVTPTETYYAHLIEESRVRAGECIADVMLRGYDGKGEKLSS